MAGPAPRRFIASVLGTLVLGLAVLWTITATLREGFLEPDYAIWRAKHQMAAACQLGGTVVLGDSRASADFIPGPIPDSVNFGLGGGSPIDMYYLTRTILACPQPPRRVLLSIAMPHLVLADTFWQRTALFGFLSFADLEEVRRRSRALGDQSIFAPPTIGDFDARVNDWLYAHHFPSFYASSLLSGAVVARLHFNRALGADTIRAGGHHLYGTRNGSDLVATDASLKGFAASPVLDEYLRRTLALLRAHGTEVDFIAAPMNEATYAAVSPEAAMSFRNYLADLARQSPNFRVIGDPLAHWDNKWFGDLAHLNEAGAHRFSERVASETLARTP